MTAVPHTSDSLLSELRDRDNSAVWTQFSAAYVPFLKSYCRRLGVQDADCDDVTQETVAAVSSVIGKFRYDPARGSFRSWLLRILHSKLSDLMRRRKRMPPAGNMEHAAYAVDAQSSDGQTTKRERQGLLEQVFDEIRREFRTNTWQAFELAAIHGLPAKEVSRSVGISVQAVYNAKNRVVKRIRERVCQLSC